LSLGVEYAASKSLTLRAGLKWAPGATEEGYLVPTANDVDLVVPSLGVGYRVGGSLELDLSTFYVSGLRATQGREAFDQDHVMLVVGARWAP
jgi:long-subunit fatty acid transport protein